MATRYHLNWALQEERIRGSRTKARVIKTGLADAIYGKKGTIAPLEDTEMDAEEGFLWNYYPEQSPLGEAMGCPDDGMSIFDSSINEEVIAHDKAVFGFEDEDPLGQVLADIADRILIAAACEDDDVGMIVSVSNSDAQDYGMMVSEIMSATSVEELQEIANVYIDMPGARALAEVCAKKMANGDKLRLVS